ncbi:hypothetical protein M431DRAFT_362923 [Trichoderma harzianum CBS 226.95]|uniref:Uncharacterized protein n=1 Tax=Trichoderma harzianum CBS 226.95 TaxID=983964 RepID=A0A2T4AMU5_TRIHA|nr:hypothetical protein M431DRAFT_362923 [Trichoderma harzianum CBS 226.95]PTB58350.1 hypothetical protein M431DRAFT_362923 [Trichoderma harzianum CBS 226.95]
MLPCVVYRAGQSGGPAPSLDARGCFDQTKSRRTSHYHWITALFLPLSTHNGAPNQPRTRSFHPARRGKIRWPEAFAHFEPWGQPEPSHYAHSIRGASGPDDAATPALSSGLCNLISLLRRVGVESSYSYGSTGLYSRWQTQNPTLTFKTYFTLSICSVICRGEALGDRPGSARTTCLGY